MELEAERLILKEVTWEDLDNIHILYSLPETDEFNTLGIPANTGVTKEYVKAMIDAQKEVIRKSYSWKIIHREDDKFIGLAGINLSVNRFRLGEIFYELLPSYWGKGYATEIARALIKCGFHNLNLHRVEAGVATENIRSIRVLEKAGMTREGIRRKILPIRGEWKDNYHYAILEDDIRS